MRAFILCLYAATFFLAHPCDSCSQEPKKAVGSEPEVRFNLLALPNARNVQQQLNAPTQGHYERVSLREILAEVERRYGVRCWIDRRVDADRPLTLTISEMNLDECLSRLAKLCDAEMGLIENVVCFAPAEKLASMQYSAVRLHDILSRNDRGGNRAQLRPLAWPKLTTPVELVEQICKTWEIQLQAELPHDLMNSGQLPPCTLATQLTLLFGGFDRCAVGNDLTKLRIANLPKAASWQAVYDAAVIPSPNALAVTNEYPAVRMSTDRKQITLAGSTAAHLRLLRPIISERTGSRPRGKTRDPLITQNYTVSLKQPQPISSVLSSFVQQAGSGLELQWDKSLSENQLQTQVTLDMKEAKLDQVLESLAAQAKLKIIRTGNLILVGPMEVGLRGIEKNR